VKIQKNIRKLILAPLLFLLTLNSLSEANPLNELPGSLPIYWEAKETNNPEQIDLILRLPIQNNNTSSFSGRLSKIKNLDKKFKEQELLKSLTAPTDFSGNSVSYTAETTLSSLSLYRGKPYRIFLQKLTPNSNIPEGLATVYFTHNQALYSLQIKTSDQPADLFEYLFDRTSGFLVSFFQKELALHKGPAHSSEEAYFHSAPGNILIPLDKNWQLTKFHANGFEATTKEAFDTRLTLKLTPISETTAIDSLEWLEKIKDRTAEELKRQKYSFKMQNIAIGQTGLQGIYISAEQKDKAKPNSTFLIFHDGHHDYLFLTTTESSNLKRLQKSFLKQIEKIHKN